MSQRVVPTQGELDGLCGIYALTAYLRDVEDQFGRLLAGPRDDRNSNAFWLLLDAAERLNMFTVDYALNGYAAHHLVRIWNEVSDSMSLERTAYSLAKVARLGNHDNLYAVAEAVVRDDKTDTALFVLVDKHWHISTSASPRGGLELWDSGTDGDGNRTITKRTFEQGCEGFVILPAGSPILAAAKQEL